MIQKSIQKFRRGGNFLATIRLVALLCLFGVISTLFFPSSAHAAQTIPYKMNFQGRLTDSTGNPKPNGQYNMKFRIMSADSGGTNLWQADRVYGASDYTVTVTNGLFTIQLGDTSKGDPVLNPSLFDTTTNAMLYLEVELPTPATATCATNACASFTEGAMTPRSVLSSAAYAFNADTVDGIDGVSLARNDAANTFTAANLFSNDTTQATNKKFYFNQYNDGGDKMQATGTGSLMYDDGTNGLSIQVSSSKTASASAVNQEVVRYKTINDGLATTVNSGVNYGDNLVDNGTFEADGAGWANVQAISTAEPATGNKHLRFVASGGSPTTAVTSRPVQVGGSMLFHVSALVKVSTVNAGTGGFDVEWLDKDGIQISTSVVDTQTNPGTSYVTRAGTVTSPSNALYAKVRAVVNGNGAAHGTWDFDNVAFKRVQHSESKLFKNATNSAAAFQIQNAAGAALFVADTTSLIVKIGGGDISPDATPALFVLDYKNTSSDPAGTNGAMYYNSSLAEFRCYQNGVWQNCIDGRPLKERFRYQQEFTEVVAYQITSGGTATYKIDTTLSALLNHGSLSTGANVTWIPTESNHPGIWRLDTGTNVSGNSLIVSPLNGLAGSVPYLFGNGSLRLSTGIRVNSLSDAINTYTIRNGLIGSSGTKGCEFLYSHNGTYSNRWEGTCNDGGTVSRCDTGVAVSSANTWFNLDMAVNSAGNSVTFTVNGTSSCTVSTNLPTVALSIGSGIIKSTGITTRSMDIDYLEFTQDGISR